MQRSLAATVLFLRSLREGPEYSQRNKTTTGRRFLTNCRERRWELSRGYLIIFDTLVLQASTMNHPSPDVEVMHMPVEEQGKLIHCTVW